MKYILRLLTGFAAVLGALLLLLSLPALLSQQGALSFQPKAFGDMLLQLARQLLQPGQLEYASSAQRMLEKPRMFPLFPNVWEPYMYSLTLVAAAFSAALALSAAMAYAYVLAAKPWQRLLRAVLFVLESIPDMMILISTQLFFIWLLRRADWAPFQIIAFGDKKAYALPILCLTILPAIQLFRMILLCLQDELGKPYVETARGKGLSAGYIMRVHLFRNIFVHVLHHAKTILLFLLSNLLVLEIVFNIPGIMRFLVQTYTGGNAVTIAVLLLIFLPFFLLFLGSSYITKKFSAQSGGVHG